jgi:hypothetical protein
MAGDGNYGGNGSIHWQNKSGSASSNGRDGIPVNNIGANSGNFQLTLRYSGLSGKSSAALVALLQEVIDRATEAQNNFRNGTSTDEQFLIQVPAIPRAAAPPPPPTAGWEIHVKW